MESGVIAIAFYNEYERRFLRVLIHRRKYWQHIFEHDIGKDKLEYLDKAFHRTYYDSNYLGSIFSNMGNEMGTLTANIWQTLGSCSTSELAPATHSINLKDEVDKFHIEKELNENDDNRKDK